MWFTQTIVAIVVSLLIVAVGLIVIKRAKSLVNGLKKPKDKE